MARLPAITPELSALYTVVGDTLVSREVEWKTEIGNRSANNRAEPHLKIRKWADTADECWLAVDFPSAFNGDSVVFDGTAFVWSRNGYQVRIYNTGLDEGGGHNFDIVVPSRPPANSFSINLNHLNCRFDYQPELTPQEIAAGHVRPPNIVGSYAVYRADNKKHGIYKTGKICHIYRPLITDFNGATTYATINITGNTLTISADAAWLDAAAYPITVDPDFGNTVAPATALSAEGQLWGLNATPSTSGTTDSVTVYVRETSADNTHQFQVALYNAAGTSNLGNSSSAQNATTTASWKTVTLSGISVTGSTAYAICFMAGGGGGAIDMYYDTSSSLTTWGQLITFPTWPATLTAGSTTRNWGIYATYTESGGATNPGWFSSNRGWF